MKKLAQGTTHCPQDNTPFHWKQFCGMRLVEQSSDGKGYSYDAMCPTCQKYYEVEAPKSIGDL